MNEAMSWATGVALGWTIVSAVLTALLHLKTDAEWVAFAERLPRVAAILESLHHLGVDLVGAVGALRKVVTARTCEAPAPGPEGGR